MNTFITSFAKEFNVNQVSALFSKETKASRQAFEYTLQAAVKVAASLTWWKEIGKGLAAEQGYTPDAEQLAQDVYGWQKSYMYKVAKAGSLPTETIAAYMEACDRVEAQGKRAERSIAALLKFAKAEAEGGNEGEEGEGEGEESVEAKAKAVLTLTCRLSDLGLSDKNVSLRIDAEGNVITTASAEDIQKAIALLTATLNA